MRSPSASKVFGTFAALFLSSLVFCTPSFADDVRIVFVTHGQATDPYWTIIQNGMKKAAAELGVSAEYRAPSTFSTDGMKQLIDAAVASHPDGLVVSVPNEAALSPSVEAATKAGIPVIMIDAGGPGLAKKLGALFFMGQSEFGAGIEAGRRAREQNAKHPVCIDHEVGNVSLEARCHGFSSGLGFNVPVLETTLDPAASTQTIKEYLVRHPETDFVLTLGTVSAEAVLDAFQEMPANSKPLVGTFDMSPRVLDAVADGTLLWSIDAQPYLMGYVPVVTLTLLKRYKLAPIRTDLMFPTGPSFVEKKDALAMKALAEQGIR